MNSAPRVLITGFDGFPGSPKNPTARMIVELAKCRPRFLRAGIRVELAVLPVIYAETAPRLAALTQKIKPHAILHFGVAARRTRYCVETRALNRMSVLRPDAIGARAAHRLIDAGAPFSLVSTAPCGLIAAALRRAGFDAVVSIDAGDYICNETLFLSLRRRYAPFVGFIHVPPLAKGFPASTSPRQSLEATTRAAATAILALTTMLRRPGMFDPSSRRA